MSVLDDYRKHHLPSKEAAKVHVRLTIKEYGQLGEEALGKQLSLTHRGLYVAGFNHKEAMEIINECLEEAGL